MVVIQIDLSNSSQLQWTEGESIHGFGPNERHDPADSCVYPQTIANDVALSSEYCIWQFWKSRMFWPCRSSNLVEIGCNLRSIQLLRALRTALQQCLSGNLDPQPGHSDPLPATISSVLVLTVASGPELSSCRWSKQVLLGRFTGLATQSRFCELPSSYYRKIIEHEINRTNT